MIVCQSLILSTAGWARHNELSGNCASATDAVVSVQLVEMKLIVCWQTAASDSGQGFNIRPIDIRSATKRLKYQFSVDFSCFVHPGGFRMPCIINTTRTGLKNRLRINDSIAGWLPSCCKHRYPLSNMSPLLFWKLEHRSPNFNVIVVPL